MGSLECARVSKIDLKLAIRQLRSNPWTTLLAVVSLGLGIGVNAAVFNFFGAVLFRATPAQDPERLVEVYTQDSGGFQYAPSSYPDFLDYRRETDAFEELSVYNLVLTSHDDGHQSQIRFGEGVSENYFDLLRVEPQLGRFFSEAELEPSPVVVLSHEFWSEQFGAREDVLGETLHLNGLPLQIVGVAAPSLTGSFPGIVAEFWVPISFQDRLYGEQSLSRRGSRSLFIKGRLAPGVSAEEAAAQLATVAGRLSAAYPDTNEDRATSVAASDTVVFNPGIDGPLIGVASLFMIVVAVVLLIACSNIANLLLARASDRQKEIAITLALGSSRARIVRQLLTEGVLIAGAAGVFGLVIAYWTAGILMRFQPPVPIKISLDLGLDSRVVWFTLFVSLVAGVASAIGPALQASRPNLVPALKDAGATLGGARGRLRLRNVLVVAQVALSSLLLVGAGLFARSLGNAQAIDPGFSIRHGVVAQLAFGLGDSYSEDDAKRFVRRFTDELRASPEVLDASVSELLPLGVGFQSTGTQVEGVIESDDEDDWPELPVNSVGPNYFATMGIPMLRGRAFEDRDTQDSPPVVVINEAMSSRFWPQQSPIGQRVRFDGDGEWHEIVGVAQNGKYLTLGEQPRLHVYRCFYQDYDDLATIVVRARDENTQARLYQGVRQQLKALDPNLPLFDYKTMTEHLEVMTFPARMGAFLLGALGILGIALASMGLYGVVAYAVSKRRRELGIRAALGASRRELSRFVVREEVTLVAVGLVIGLLLGSGASFAVRSLLYEVAPFDPLTLIAVSAVLLSVALAASWGPARRASRVDPIVALRNE